MAILAESLVEEWLNREGFFTIRGVKHGIGEIDLLAIRHEPRATVIGWHVEVQASFRPVRYIAKLTAEMARASNRARTTATARTPEQIETCARDWVRSKFKTDDKAKARERLWPNVQWSYHLVHAIVREHRELEVFQQEGVTCHPFRDLLEKLSSRSDHHFSGSAGGDLAEIMTYYSMTTPPQRR
jgi:Holliday junction resolvase-like predicted endonuclease